jgi:hypothetical protein
MLSEALDKSLSKEAPFFGNMEGCSFPRAFEKGRNFFM